MCIKVNKEDLTLKELNSLAPTYGLFDGINFTKVDYYKDEDTGKIFELSYCSNDSLHERIKELKKVQEINNMLKIFGVK